MSDFEDEERQIEKWDRIFTRIARSHLTTTGVEYGVPLFAHHLNNDFGEHELAQMSDFEIVRRAEVWLSNYALSRPAVSLSTN